MNNADKSIDAVLSVMKYGVLYEFDSLEDMVEINGLNHGQLRLCLDEMVHENMIERMNKVRTGGLFEYVDIRQLPESVTEPHYRLTVHGNRIRNSGGWGKHKKSLNKKRFIDGDAVKYIYFLLALIGAIAAVISLAGWAPFIDWIVEMFQ